MAIERLHFGEDGGRTPPRFDLPALLHDDDGGDEEVGVGGGDDGGVGGGDDDGGDGGRRPLVFDVLLHLLLAHSPV